LSEYFPDMISIPPDTHFFSQHLRVLSNTRLDASI